MTRQKKNRNIRTTRLWAPGLHCHFSVCCPQQNRCGTEHIIPVAKIMKIAAIINTEHLYLTNVCHENKTFDKIKKIPKILKCRCGLKKKVVKEKMI